jgi:hypothetical protein
MTALYTAIVADVMLLLARPELADEVALAVRTSTRSAHLGGSYPRDSRETDVTLAVPAYTAQLAIDTYAPRCRGLTSVQAVDATDLVVYNPAIDIVELGDLLDPEYGTVKNNIAYLAGTTINIRSSIAMTKVRLTYFHSPDVTEAVYDSWIALLAPDIIIYGALAIVARGTGNAERATQYMEMINKELRPQLNSSFATSANR